MPGQPFTPEVSDTPKADEWLRKLGDRPALRTPIDVEARVAALKCEPGEDGDDESGEDVD